EPRRHRGDRRRPPEGGGQGPGARRGLRAQPRPLPARRVQAGNGRAGGRGARALAGHRGLAAPGHAREGRVGRDRPEDGGRGRRRVKPPRYPLQAVVDQREALKEDAKRALAAAIESAAWEAEALKQKEAALETARREREEFARHLYDPDERGLLQLATIEKRTEGLRLLDQAAREGCGTVQA